MATAINLNLASAVGGGGSRWPFNFCFWKDMIPRNLFAVVKTLSCKMCGCDLGIERCFFCCKGGSLSGFSLIEAPTSLISNPDCACACAPGHASTYRLAYRVSYSTLPLPRTRLPSQPGMKTSWHLTKGINHPWPCTNYPSLPTLYPPLRGEPRNNGATWKSATSQGRALMDTPVRPRLLGSPGRLTFKSLSLSDGTGTKEAIVQDQGLWPLEMKWRGPLAMKREVLLEMDDFKGLREQEKETLCEEGKLSNETLLFN